MARFKPGQEVVCVKRTWGASGYKGPAFGPAYNEIVTVFSYGKPEYLYLVEYPRSPDGSSAGFWEGGFEPVVPSEVIEELMEETKIEAI